MSLSVSLAPLHYCLIAISARQASSQNDYYELACVSSLCIMQSPCHALQQRLAHTHRRTRAHTEAQTDMLWHDTSTHTLQLSCKCLAPIVLVAVLLLPSKSVLKISPWSVCRHLSILPPSPTQPVPNLLLTLLIALLTFTFPTLRRQFRAPWA